MQHNQYSQQGYIVESDNPPRLGDHSHSRGSSRGSDRGQRYYAGGYMETLQGIKRFIATVLALAFIILVGLGVFAVRELFPLVGILAIVSASILLICGVAWVVVSTIRHATRADYFEMGEFGGYFRNALGRTTPLAPMIAAPTKISKATGKVEITPEVPTLFDLIDAGEIVVGQLEMIMGYAAIELKKGILQLIAGPWPGTHAVAGKGRSGKTRRVIGEVTQALIAGARVIVCDPHYTKPDSLANSLAPLEKYLIIARGEAQIVAAARDFMREMEARVDDKNHLCSPWLIIFDEWSRLMNTNNNKMDDDGRELLMETALRCSTEFAGYLGYCCLIGQVWTNEAAGGTDVRRSLQSVFIHQLSAEYAQFFLRAAKWKNRAEELKRRECIYKDNDGAITEILTIGVPDDTAQRVAGYLASQGFPAIAAPASLPPLPEYQEPARLGDRGEPRPLQLPAPGEFSPAGEIHPEYTYSRLPGFSSGESENTVNALPEGLEDIGPLPPKGEKNEARGETFTMSAPAAQGEENTPAAYSREQETAILKAAFQLARENKGGKVTRAAIQERLGWNNKAYPALKAVCDKHAIG